MGLEFLHLSPKVWLQSGGLWRWVICYDVAVSMRWRSANCLSSLWEVRSAYSSMIGMLTRLLAWINFT